MESDPVLFGVNCRPVVFMSGHIILFDVAGVIIIPIQGWTQHTVGQTVTVCWQNPQGDTWTQIMSQIKHLFQ